MGLGLYCRFIINRLNWWRDCFCIWISRYPEIITGTVVREGGENLKCCPHLNTVEIKKGKNCKVQK
jgi:hypothetical protein